VITQCVTVARTTLVASVLAASLLFAGCDTPPPPTDALSVQVDSSGAVPVMTVAGEAPEWSLDSLSVIRADPEVGFSGIRSIALDPRGGVWVADTRERRLSHWGDDGVWIEDRGRVGSGPGEFRFPNSVMVHNDGLYVHDAGNSRVLRFDLSADSDTSWLTASRVTGDPMVVRLYPNRRGPLLFDRLRSAESPRTLFLGNASNDSIIAPLQTDQVNSTKVCPVGDAIRFFSSPFAPYPRTVPVGDGVVESASDGSYRLSWYDARGELQRVTQRVTTRAPVTDEEFQSATAEWRQFSDSMGSPTCDGEIIQYAEKPSVRALLPDAEGRLWVEQQRADGVVYEVWENDALLARVAAPEREVSLPPVMLGDRLAVARSLPDGGQEVRLFRIRKEAPAGPPLP
jgi:hypothetical protein